MRILFVENHAAFAAVVTRAFLSEHDVVCVPSLAEARAAHGPFDAVLVDFDLDDGKGDVFVRELVAAGFSGRIVATSAHANDRLIAAGAHASCPKSAMAQIAEFLRW